MGKSLQQSFNCRESYIFTIIMFSMLWLLIAEPLSPYLCSTSPCICFKQPLWNVNVDLLFSLSYVFPSLTRNISTTTINGKYLADCENERGSDIYNRESHLWFSFIGVSLWCKYPYCCIVYCATQTIKLIKCHSQAEYNLERWFIWKNIHR